MLFFSDANVAVEVQTEQHACKDAIMYHAEKHRLQVHRQAEKHRRWSQYKAEPIGHYDGGTSCNRIPCATHSRSESS